MPTPIRHCALCRHWQALARSFRTIEAPAGECHALPPARDWQWPRTTADGHCASWAENPEFAIGTPGAASSETSHGREELTLAADLSTTPTTDRTRGAKARKVG